MRVANIIEEGKLGGPQTRIVQVAAALSPRVETVVIMPEDNSEDFRRQCEAREVPYRTFRLSRITRDWKVALRYLTCWSMEISRLCRFFRTGGFDLVHVSGGSWQYKGVLAGKLAGQTVLWHLNDTSMPWLLRRLFAVFSRYADGYIYASERTRTYYAPLVKAGKPGFVIPAPVDTRWFDPRGRYDGDEELIAQWEGKTVIGTVANVNPVKGLDVFIHAAALLNARLDNTVFVVLGTTYKSQQGYLQSLQQLCKKLSVDNLLFAGGRADVRPLLSRYDVYVCSSRFESSPISVWEALSMGKAVVSTDVGDVPLYVREGYNGYIVDVGDAGALSDRLAGLVGDRELSAFFGHRGREVAAGELDIARCARLHTLAYRKIHDLQQS